jgi:hypothetical protein
MLKWLFAGFFCVSSLISFPQTNLNQNDYLTTGQYFCLENSDDCWKSLVFEPSEGGIMEITGINGNMHSLSNSLSNKFVYAVFTNKFIDNNLKKTNAISNANNYFNSINFQLYYKSHFKNKSGLGYLISLSDHYYTNIRFSRDYFNFLFYGNKEFAGKTADLSGFKLNFIKYQKLRFGLSISKWDILSIFLSAAMVRGLKNLRAEFNNAGIYTEQTGEYVDFNLNYNYFSSDTANSNINKSNGLGYATDLFISYIIGKNNKDVRLYLLFENFGKIYWNKNSHKVSNDTSFSYSGEQLQSVLDFGAVSFTQFSGDSLKEDFYYSKAKKGKYQTDLPSKVTFAASFFISNLFFCSPGMYYYCYSNMQFPYFYLANKRYFGKPHKNYCALILQPGYGGYGGFQCGLGVEFWYRRFHFKISSGNLPGFFIPEKTYSQSFIAGLDVNLKKYKKSPTLHSF